MDIKKVSIAGIIFLVAVLVLWVFFFADKKGKMEILQENSRNEENPIEEQAISESALATENVSSAEIVEKTPEQIVDDFKQQQQKSTETVIKSEEVIKESTPSKSSVLNIVDKLVSSGFQKVSAERKVDTIIIHSSYNALSGDQYDTDKIIAIYKSYGVSAHYLIGRDGTALRLVKDNDIAYHAGVSKAPDGRTNVNDFSIGIEIVGNKTDGYKDKQYMAVVALVDLLKKKYEIKYVLGHSDIAPDRKDDPWKFEWNKLNK